MQIKWFVNFFKTPLFKQKSWPWTRYLKFGHSFDWNLFNLTRIDPKTSPTRHASQTLEGLPSHFYFRQYLLNFNSQLWIGIDHSAHWSSIRHSLQNFFNVSAASFKRVNPFLQKQISYDLPHGPDIRGFISDAAMLDFWSCVSSISIVCCGREASSSYQFGQSKVNQNGAKCVVLNLKCRNQINIISLMDQTT